MLHGRLGAVYAVAQEGGEAVYGEARENGEAVYDVSRKDGDAMYGLAREYCGQCVEAMYGAGQ